MADFDSDHWSADIVNYYDSHGEFHEGFPDNLEDTTSVTIHMTTDDGRDFYYDYLTEGDSTYWDIWVDIDDAYESDYDTATG